MSRRLALIATLTALVMVGVAGTTTSGAIRKVALGIAMRPDRDIATYDAFKAQSGRAPAIWTIRSDWGGPNKLFPSAAFLNHIRSQGSVPMITWTPVVTGDLNNPRFTYRNILADAKKNNGKGGVITKYIKGFAKAARNWGGRVILRFAHEMDGYWFPWGIGRFTNTTKNFKAAWRHIWGIFKGPKGVGATRVKFLWSPNNPCGGCVPYKNVYPGDRYVDYVGFSAFNWGPPSWRSMPTALNSGMVKITQLGKAGIISKRKKVIIAETGSSPIAPDPPGPTPPDPLAKAKWIRDGYPAVYERWPRIKAIVYFNVDTSPEGQEDWRLTTPPAAFNRYRALLTEPRFQGVIP
jgi:hypothetical protein